MMKNKKRVIEFINMDALYIDTFLKKSEEYSEGDGSTEYWLEAYRQQLAIYQGKIDLLEVMGYDVVCEDLSYRVIDINQKKQKK